METPASSSGTASPVKTPDIQELVDLQSDKRLQRLQFLVERSKIYASILSQRLAVQPDPSVAREASTTTAPETATATPPPEETTKRRRQGRKTKASLAAETAQKKTTAKKQQKSILNFVKKEKKAVEEVEMDDGKPEFKQPKLITGGTLHDYQLAGVQWMVSLFENGLNGILADEMGLGKTLQVIAFIAYLLENNISGPFLIVAPLSTIENWIKEFNRFAPEIPVVKYHGLPQERARLRNIEMKHSSQGDAQFPVIVTSYEIIINDGKYLGKYLWKYIIVDEGHRLKNMSCRLIKQLKKFESANRLLLTGTPLQNNLIELWSLLNFLLPDIFSDLELFQAWFEKAGEEEEESLNETTSENLISSLHAILRPFLLRRLKTDISMFLPDKREYVIYGGLTDDQTEMYEHILQRNGRDYVINKIIEYREGKGKVKRIDVVKKQEKKVIEQPKETDEEEEPIVVSTATVRTSKRLQTRNNNKKYATYDDDDEDDEKSDDEFIESLQSKIESDLSVTDAEKGEQYDDETTNLIKLASNETRSKSFQNMVMQLRLACNSPYLFYYPWTGDEPVDETLITISGKMMLLDRLTTRLVKDGHKVLIFSQFTKMLDVLEDWLTDLKKWNYCRIDGSTDQMVRQEQMDKFNSTPEYKIFLLSTRSGGLGINLTAADTVILFDSDWNPQQDLQAMDRVHRIGQKNPVIIYRLATSNTVEQQLLDRAGAKRKLEQMVIEKGRFKGFGFEGTSQDEVLENMKLQLVKNKTASKSSLEISPSDFEKILDRSPEAYERARLGTEKLADNITTIISSIKPKLNE